MKGYFKKRKDIVRGDSYDITGDNIMLLVARTLKKDANQPSVDFFIDECSSIKDKVLHDIQTGRVTVSEGLHRKI